MLDGYRGTLDNSEGRRTLLHLSLCQLQLFHNLLIDVVFQLHLVLKLIDLLGVSANTVRKWRDDGLIGYSKAGGCYLYSLADIEKFLADTHYDSFISED